MTILPTNMTPFELLICIFVFFNNLAIGIRWSWASRVDVLKHFFISKKKNYLYFLEIYDLEWHWDIDRDFRYICVSNIHTSCASLLNDLFAYFYGNGLCCWNFFFLVFWYFVLSLICIVTIEELTRWMQSIVNFWRYLGLLLGWTLINLVF